MAVDSNFTDSDLLALSGSSQDIKYCRALEGPDVFDLVLLLDVVEHVEDDAGLLAELVEKRLSKGGRVLVTVPAFNVRSLGCLFSTILLSQPASSLVEKAFGASSGDESEVGSWRGGRLLTAAVKAALEFDNAFSLALNRALGLRLPGLTGWVLCERQR